MRPLFTQLRSARRVRFSCGVVGLALTAIWVFSLIWHTSYTHYGSWAAACTMGSFGVESFDPPLSPPHRWGGHTVDQCVWQFFRANGVMWWPDFHTSTIGASTLTSTFIPLWMPAAFSLAVAYAARRAVQRIQRRDCCELCHHDRTGIPVTARCPECGITPGTIQAANMSPVQRRWRRIGRVCMAVCIVIALVWLVSLRLSITYMDHGSWIAGLREGAVAIAAYSPPLSSDQITPRIQVERSSPGPIWLPFVRNFGPGVRSPPITWSAGFPLWIPCVACAGIVVFARRRVRLLWRV